MIGLNILKMGRFTSKSYDMELIELGNRVSQHSSVPFDAPELPLEY